MDQASPTVEAGVLPAGFRIYAVGDIHGRFDLLQTLSGMMRHDLENARPARAIEIYVGDYVDRGPDTRKVVEWMIETPPLADERICLLGNHEDMLLQALDDPSAMRDWLFNGGGETIASYLSGEQLRSGLSSPEAIRDVFLQALPVTHRAFLSSLPRMVEFGGYLFVHAGLRPGRPVHDQDPYDLIWIREPFLRSTEDFGKIVVHGHTPASRPEVRRNRINIDTGAVFSGCLTCLVLEGATQRFLQT
jgi:diadenosine tetraphosphatase ApaH/serine/threonine PP2A family protein phosphatase